MCDHAGAYQELYSEGFISSLSWVGIPHLINLFSWQQQHLRVTDILWLIKTLNLSFSLSLFVDEFSVYTSGSCQMHEMPLCMIKFCPFLVSLTRSFSSSWMLFWFSCVLMMPLKFALSVNLIVTFSFLVPESLLSKIFLASLWGLHQQLLPSPVSSVCQNFLLPFLPFCWFL